MPSKTFNKWNTILGWFVFLIAFVVYSLTVEPTTSFWDPGEYITTASKLEVGHPPGAPFFQMTGAFFSLFASDATQIAKMVNYVSVTSSAFTVLLLFWIATNLLSKIYNNNVNDHNKSVLIFIAAFIGALSFTFSDTFWFSAVESEVYAMAMLFLALIFWIGLKWIDSINDSRQHKWLILLGFVSGLSFGIHFMALLAIPAVVLLYLFENKKKLSFKTFITYNIVAIGTLIFIFKLLIPYTLKFFGYTEVFMVNRFGLPFNSGTIIAAVILIFSFYLILKYTRKKNWVMANNLVVCTLFIFIGFSSWLLIPIRANAGVTINIYDPSDARQLLAYYNLEQYPETHIVNGPVYSDMFAEENSITPYKDDKPKYERDKKSGKYIIVNSYKNALQAPNEEHIALFPRMWSAEHAEGYMMLTGMLSFNLKPEYANQKELITIVDDLKKGIQTGDVSQEGFIRFLKEFRPYINVQKPTLVQNLNYFFKYQVGYMYWRYFMWNFSGRQDDIQGQYNNHGNWISGISAIDEKFIGPQNNLPSDILNNKARNTYYLLPLILGIIGFIASMRKNPKLGWVLITLFLFTGIALKIYLNERPFEPRERDYVLVGSFYVFTMWIALGAFSVLNDIKKLWSHRLTPSLVSGLCLFCVPILMAQQNWDDHDRSGKFSARTIAMAYLDSVQKNKDAILFTVSDNDTYPLWYLQEVEGYRRDVKTVNASSLLSAYWHIDQAKRKTYKSNPIPSQLEHKQYAWGVRDIIRYEKLTDAVWSIQDFMNWVSSDDPKTQYGYLLKQAGIDLSNIPEATKEMIYYPTNKIRVPVNKKNVLESGIVSKKDEHLIVDYIDIELPESYITKNRLIMLDIIANNDWKRPINFTGGPSDPAEYIWMKDYLQLNGLVYTLVPIQTKASKNTFELGRIDTDKMYDIVMDWEWGNSGKTNIYYDPRTRVNGITYRANMARLIEKLIAERKFDKALHVLDLGMEKLPVDAYGYYIFLEPFIEGYYQIGAYQKARDLYKKVAEKYQEHLYYYSMMDNSQHYRFGSEILSNIQYYNQLVNIITKYEKTDIAEKEMNILKRHMSYFNYLFEKN